MDYGLPLSKEWCPENVSVWEVSYFYPFLWPCLGSFHIWGQFLGEDNFWAKMLKTDNFVSLIAPQKQPLQKKYCIPWWSQRKMMRDKNNQKFLGCILGVVICLTKSTFFWFFEKSKNRRFCVANFSMKTVSTEKIARLTR